MNQFFLDAALTPQQTIVFEDQEHRHISSVLRKTAGEPLYVTNGRGTFASCVILSSDRKQTVCKVESVTLVPAPHERILCFGLIKHRERLDWMIEKSVELGVTRLWPLQSDHSEKEKVNSGRAHQLMVAALKQSKRCWLPEWSPFISIEAAIAELGLFTGLEILVADELDEAAPAEIPDKSGGLAFFVGPEGGFSARERLVFQEKKVQAISLGRNRLRAETASIALLARYLHNQLG